MKRILGVTFVTLMMACLAGWTDTSAEGRWKIGDNGCYWDQNDSGPNQCGRWKVGGETGCYWDGEDSGPDQCSPGITEEQTSTAYAFAVALNNNVTGTSIADVQAALELAYAYGIIGDPPGDLSDLNEYIIYPYDMSCLRKNALYDKAQKAALSAGIAAGLLAVATGASVAFFPPAAPALGVAAGFMGVLTATANYVRGEIGNASCH